MLTTLEMESAANTVEALQVATLEEGRIHANVFRFRASSEVGFRLWRWAKFRDGWRRAQLFQAADLEKISLLFEQLDASASVPEPQDSKPIALEFREYVPTNLVLTFHHGKVQTFICDPQQPKPVEPYFVIRKTAEDSSRTASWFLTSDLSDLRKSLDQVRSWYQQLSHN